MLVWACALGILSLSAMTSGNQFHYNKGNYRRTEDCNVCYAEDCLVLDQARCDYYMEVENLLSKEDVHVYEPENPQLRKEVDALIFDLIEKAATTGSYTHMQCIPFISRYSDCNKENICTGCRTCSCDSEGRWNCSMSQQCHTKDAELNIDHRVLVMVLENLMDAGNARKTKRSVTETPEEPKMNASTITLEEMSEWLYGVKPLSKQDYSPTDFKPTPASNSVKARAIDEAATTSSDPYPFSGLTTTEFASAVSNISDNDYVAFDEVLRSIAVDTKTYSRRKPLDNSFSNQSFAIDYMLMDEDNVTSDNTTDDLSYLVNFMQDDYAVTPSTVDETTKVFIDLLEAAARARTKMNETQDYDVYNKDEFVGNVFENTNDIVEYNAVNIMKREAPDDTKSTVTPNVTFIINTTNTSYITDENVDLTNTVLLPLNRVISVKIKELEELKNIKENLLKYIKIDEEDAEDLGLSENNTSNTYFSIYNLAMNPDAEIDFRAAPPNELDQYMFKLKSDIYEVIQDITLIQKLMSSELPDDLKYLIHAMKRYVYKSKGHETKSRKSKSKKNQYTRRSMDQSFGRCLYISFRDCVIQIVEAIDKDMPKTNGLDSLSPAARKIMKYIITNYYSDDYAAIGLRVHDPQYNMTNDLKQVGSKWQEMTASIISSSPFVTLYRMKLLHFVLSMDVSKMTDALALVDFAHSRRMFPSLDNVSDEILDKINNGLKAIHNKIQIIIRYYAKKPKPQTITITFRPRAQEDTTVDPFMDTLDSRKKKKRSFIKHIRSLLKSSKKDIAELLHRKVPKSEIVKQLAKKKLDKISEKRYSEYQETMKRWQKNLDLAPRLKRSMLDNFKARIKNIIPNYLRHKVTPRIKENQKNATAIAGRKAEDRNKKRKKRKNKRNTTTTRMKSSENATPKITRMTTHAIASTKKQNVTATKP